MKKMWRRLMNTCLPLLLITGSCKAQTLKPVSGGASGYSIVIPADAGKSDRNAAALLKNFIQDVTGASLPLVTENNYKGTQAIYIGKTTATTALPEFSRIQNDGFLLAAKGKNLFISGRHGHSSEYAVYYFSEHYLGCRKYDGLPPFIPKARDISLPGDLSLVSNPAFVYRQAYYPMSNDAEYLNWHGLHRFEDLWGLWGHSFFRLLPPKDHFAAHPEYYALVNGERAATQLCLSNAKVLEITINKLKQLMSANPDAEYWSVSPNDGGGNCTCPDCRKADEEEGSPSGSLIRFVNRVAAAFPGKKITTLGYGYTAHAPTSTRPASNVVILVSTIDAYREKPLQESASAAGFRKDLEGWRKTGVTLFVWDYTTEFTNYLAPFPVLTTLQPNLRFFSDHGITGAFEQGSGDTYSDMAELNSYLLAKLLWDPSRDVKELTADFCKGYYGKGAPYVLQYLDLRSKALAASGKRLDIYGNPIDDRRSFLAPELLQQYEDLLQKAQAAVSDAAQAERIRRVRLPLEYARLQQSRHYGAEERGFLESGGSNAYTVKREFRQQVNSFVTAAKKAGVTELSEGGLTPDQYRQEWEAVLNRSWPVNLAYNGKVTLQYPFVEDYPAKGNHTLTDGMTGFMDFSYNWLCFYGTDMVATVETEKVKSFSGISINFLDDPRHWIFLPVSLSVSWSEDGVHYTPAGETVTGAVAAHDNASIRTYSFKVPGGKARFFKVTARNNTALPSWRNYSNKKPMIACDEIMVVP